MSELPLISIILPVYNGEKYLRDSIDSCINQSYSNWELIIINDASTDATFRIVEEYQERDGRIKVYSNKSNLSLPGSLNKGHKIAQGDFLTWTSDDNILKKNFLQVLYQYFQSSECDIVFSNYDIIWKDGSLKREHVTGPVGELLFGNTIGASFLYKKKVFIDIGGYSDDLFLAEDYNFFLMASLKFRILHVNENLYKYRIHQESLTGAIQSEKTYRLKHKESIHKMFNNLGHQLKMDNTVTQFLIDIYLKNKLSVNRYLSIRKLIEKELIRYSHQSKSIKKKEVFTAFHRRLLNNWLQNDSDITKTDIIKLALANPSLLLNGFKNRETIKLSYRLFSN